MPKKGKPPTLERKLRAKDILGLPAGTKVYLLWQDKYFGKMRAPYVLLGNGKMKNLIVPDILIEIKDYQGKHYAIAGDEKSWDERLTEERKENRKKTS